jgi:hypothetical protein
MALEGMVKTPFGEVKKKTAAIVGIGGVGLLGIVYYRSKKNAGSSTPATSSDTSSTDSTDSSNIDPATGYPYGSAEDVQALQSQQMIGGGFGSVYGGGPGGSTTPGTTPGAFTTNAQWSQYAEDYLVNTVGLNASDVGNALGKYLTGQPVTSDMVVIINQAIAFAGAVPVPGANGNPPGFNQVSGGSTVAVPNVIGMETGAGDRQITGAGLKFAHATLKGGVGSTITALSPPAGTQVPIGSTVNVTFKEKK